MIGRKLLKILRDERGVAAIELAMVAPVIAGLAVMSFAIWETGTRRQNMRAALDVGAEYYMNGGSDDAAAVTLAENAWRHMPPGAEVTTSRICRCGDEILLCTAYCDGGAAPSVFVILNAAGEQPDALMQASLAQSRTIRVR